VVRLIGYLLLFAGTASLTHAQFFEFLADWSDTEPSDHRPLVADITATLKARTPWGEIITVESGKYWRNSKGQDRFDDSYGLSNMRDRRGPVIHVRIDRQLRLIDIEEKTAPREPTSLRTDPWSILPFNYGKTDPKKAGAKTVEGLKAAVRTGQDHGVSYEVWTSDELGLVLFAQYKTDRTVFEQRVHNIRLAEPDPEIVNVSVPSGFRTHITCSSISGPDWEAPRQTYEPGRGSCQ
jgi:hypothetical protein